MAPPLDADNLEINDRVTRMKAMSESDRQPHFQWLMDKLGAHLYRAVRRQQATPDHDREDMQQECAVVMWRAINDWNGTGKFSAYCLYRCQRHLIDRHRALRGRKRLPDDPRPPRRPPLTSLDRLMKEEGGNKGAEGHMRWEPKCEDRSLAGVDTSEAFGLLADRLMAELDRREAEAPQGTRMYAPVTRAILRLWVEAVSWGEHSPTGYVIHALPAHGFPDVPDRLVHNRLSRMRPILSALLHDDPELREIFLKGRSVRVENYISEEN